MELKIGDKVRLSGTYIHSLKSIGIERGSIAVFRGRGLGRQFRRLEDNEILTVTWSSSRYSTPVVEVETHDGYNVFISIASISKISNIELLSMID